MQCPRSGLSKIDACPWAMPCTCVVRGKMVPCFLGLRACPQPRPAPMNQPATLQSLPLFPLGTVLFPGGILSLRIFEVRYLDMIGKCHRAGAPFGVVTLSQGGEVRTAQSGQEQFHDVGTLARITHLSSPQAGLLLIRCEGLDRFAIQRRECLRHGLWIADVARLPPDPAVAVPADLAPVAVALEQVYAKLRQRAESLGESGPQPAPDAHDQLPKQEQISAGLTDCAWVANRWCELLPLQPEPKQRLMALDNPLMRLELVNDFLRQAKIVA
jgi:uncharacterized protein